MSLLPGQMLPQSAPIGKVSPDGATVIMETNYWLLFYNLCQQVLGNGSGLPADALQDLGSVDLDAIDSDAIAVRRPLSNALVQALQASDVIVGLDDLPDLQRALLLAQDALLPDPAARAAPVAAITVGASPFTYTAAFAGAVSVSGSTTSVTLIRGGSSISTGQIVGFFPVSRADQLTVVYPGAAPTMLFIPGSPA